MRKFELCFDLQPDKEFLIPDILPKEEPYTGEWDNALTFEYHYPVYINSIISRFIVRMNHYIHQNTYWRTGVVLSHEGNIALVKGDREDRMIKIRVKGKEKTRRNLLSIIRSEFVEIHRTISGLDFKEKIRLSDKPEVLLDYQNLLVYEDAGEEYIFIAELRKKVFVSELLDGVEAPSDRLSNAVNTPNININQIHFGTGDNAGNDKNIQ